MIKNRLRFAGVGIIGSILALVLILAPVPSHAKEKAKDAGSVAALEKKCWRNLQRKSHFDKGKFAAHQEKYGKRERKLKRVKKYFP